MTSHVGFPQAVLSQRLGEAVGGRRVRSAVFTTFNFDPGFFELQVLSLLFSQSFSQVDKVRLLQLEDALRDVDHLAVYYDRRALSQDAEPARLDYRRIDVRRATGVFHPKLALLLVDEPREPGDDTREPHQSLVVACLSANLSRAGWWENVECAHIEEVRDRDRSSNRAPYRRDLLAILRRIRACATESDDLQDDAVVNVLMEALDGTGAVKLCVDPRVGKHQDRIYVRRELLFDTDATRVADVVAMFENTLFPAVRLHAVLEDASLLGTSVD